ncbi:YJR039W [Zygosaccharomyces parabailii]|nr:YJR039W [Zygosaccharomyces parabailii]CDH16571.1 uncharacterized protein ZBAI_08359 [Zygosaccharomyces bailii ISA1307]
MEEHVVLGRLHTSRNVVECFLLKNGFLALIEREHIKKALYTDDLRHDDMTIVPSSGYNVAASIYWEPLIGEEYLFVLKDCGALEILNSHFKRIDLLETNIELDETKKFILFNNKNQIYVNLTKSSIYAIEYQVKNRGMSFVKKDETLKCIFEDISTIIGMDFQWNIDFYTGREYPVISVLLASDINSQNNFQAICQNGTKNGPWESIVNRAKLDFDESDDSSDRRPILKTISNVGFFVFFATRVLFIKMPNGYDQTVGGNSFNSYGPFDAISLKYTSSEIEENKIKLSADVMMKRDAASLEFWFFTPRSELLKFKLVIELEDPDELIMHWSKLTCEKFSVVGLKQNESNGGFLQRSIFLSKTVASLLNDSVGIMFVDLEKGRLVNEMRFHLSQFFYSDTIGGDFRKTISCGASAENTGFIEYKFWGYSDILAPIKSFTSEEEIVDLWNSEQGIWWKNSKGQIFHEGQLIETFLPPIHVTPQSVVLRDTSIAVWTNIINDFEGNYTYVSKSGEIGWSDEHEKVFLENLKSSALAKYILSCSRLNNGLKITILSVDNKITVLENNEIVKMNVDLSHYLDSLSSVSIVQCQQTYRILVCDIGGQLCELDSSSLDVCCKLKIGTKKVQISVVPESTFYILYNKDDVMLMDSAMDDIRITKLDVQYRLRKVVAKNSCDIACLDEDHKIYQFRIPKSLNSPQIISKILASNTHFHTKILCLPCSTRYVITSSLCSEYSNILKRLKYHAELQLHDLGTQETVFRYDLSNEYPQATISDMVAFSFHKSTFEDHSLQSNSFAMQLAFDRVFVVSLNYEMAEEESLDNLLLFSLDDGNGSIDLLQGINTGYSISALHAYDNRVVLAAGHVLQAYQIDYTVKENAFKITTVSNEVYTGGLIKNFIDFPNFFSLAPQTKRLKIQKPNSDLENNKKRVAVFNLVKGLQKFDLTWSSKDQQEPLRIVPVVDVGQAPFLSVDTAERLMVAFSVCRMDTSTWLAVAFSNKSLLLYCMHGSDEPSSLQMKLPDQVTGIFSTEKLHSFSHVRKKESLIRFKRRSLSMLFVFVTSKGMYGIGKAVSSEFSTKLESSCVEEMTEQFKFIRLENGESEIRFTDARILPPDGGAKMFEVALL